MSTSPENTLTNFDLDLLLCGSTTTNSSSSTFQLSETNNYGFESLMEISESTNPNDENQDIGITDITDHNYYQIQNNGNNENTNQCYSEFNILNELSPAGHAQNEVVYTEAEKQLKKLSSDYESLKTHYESKNKDYATIKKQYAKVASDFAKLHEVNKGHVLDFLSISNKCDAMENRETGYLAKLEAFEKLTEHQSILILAERNHVAQYKSYAEELTAQIASLQNNVKSLKSLGKDARKMISTLRTNNQTQFDHLCLFVSVIEGRLQLNRESRRLMKKYCKMINTAGIKNTELECFENQSIDTGRESSLAISDSDRGFYSPSYSMSLSPFSNVTSTTRKEHSKIMKDVSTSTPEIIKTLNISTSPIIFERGFTSNIVKTSDAATNTMIYHEANSPVAKARTTNIATSPINLTAMTTPVAKAKTLDIGTSPTIKFDANTTPVPKTETLDIATSPINFTAMTTSVARAKTLDIGTNPIKFAAITTPVAKTETLDIATSPIMFTAMTTPVTKAKTLDIATSPIMFTAMTTPVAKAKTLDIGTSPLKFAPITTPVSKTETLDIATSPIKFAAITTPVAKTETLDIATSPIKFTAITTPVAKAETLDIATSPINFTTMTTPVAKAKTLDIGSRPIKFAAMTTPVANTKTLDIGSRVTLIEFADARIPVTKAKTSEISPVKILTADIKNPVTNVKSLGMSTSPIEFSDTRTPVPKYPDTIIPVAKTLTKSLNRLHTVRPLNCTDAKSTEEPVKKATNKIQRKYSVANNSNTYHIEDSLDNQCTDSETINTCNVSSITEKLKEVVSKQDQSQDNVLDDWEIKMILRKQNMNYDMLSPISLTPEVEQNEQTMSESIETNNETLEQSAFISKKEVFKESDPLIESRHMSGDDRMEYSEDGIDSEVSSSTVETLQNVGTSDNVYDLMKGSLNIAENETIKRKVTHSLFEKDVELESQHVILNKNHDNVNKTHGTSTKFKKLTKLQKIYKANLPKSKIQPQVHKYAKNQRPKPYSIAPMKTSTQNIEKTEKLDELNVKAEQLFKKQNRDVEISEKNVATRPVSQANNSRGLPHNQTNPSPELDSKRLQTETQLNFTSDILRPPTNQSTKSDPRKRVSISRKILPNILIDLPHEQPNPILEQNTKALRLSSESYSNNKNDIPSVQINQPEYGPSWRRPTKPHMNRIPRAKGTNKGISTNLALPCDQAYSNITNEKTSCTRDTVSLNNLNAVCDANNSENDSPLLISEIDLPFSYPKQLIKRIARTKKDISTNHPLTSNRADIKNTKETISCIDDSVSPNKDGVHELSSPKAHNGSVNDALEFDDKLARVSNSSQEKTVKIQASMVTCENENGSVNVYKNYEQTNLSISLTDSNEMVKSCNVWDTKKQDDDEIYSGWTQNVLNNMIYKYAAKPGKMLVQRCQDEDNIAMKIKTGVDKCVKSDYHQYYENILEFANELKAYGKDGIISGLKVFLNNPALKPEFIIVNKNQKAYQMRPIASKSELVLIHVIQILDKDNMAPTFWDSVLDTSETILFSLEKGATPCFDVIEVVAHFYANICKHRSDLSRLWMFMLNAMYCLSFKAIPLLKHCLDLMPEVLPHANESLEPGIRPLIRCFVFLLNYYNCEDPFKRIDELRRKLKYKYAYNLQDENETTILFLLKECIVQTTGNVLESYMLRMSLLIVAKRRGTKWCHKNIVQKFLLPMIKGEIEVPHTGKRFCIRTIGPIIKPYNKEMTVHSEEVVNVLIKMFEQPQPHDIKEDIILSLIDMNMKTITERLNTCLLKWNALSVSPELEKVLKEYVKKFNLKSWQNTHQNYLREI